MPFPGRLNTPVLLLLVSPALAPATGIDPPPPGAPEYCKDPNYGTTNACFGTHPAYCSDSNYANLGACFATRPEYCNDPNYATSLACASAALSGMCAAGIACSSTPGRPVPVPFPVH